MCGGQDQEIGRPYHCDSHLLLDYCDNIALQYYVAPLFKCFGAISQAALGYHQDKSVAAAFMRLQDLRTCGKVADCSESA